MEQRGKVPQVLDIVSLLDILAVHKVVFVRVAVLVDMIGNLEVGECHNL